MTSEERRAWLAALSVGDEVAVVGFSFHDQDLICKIERLTPTQFVLDETGIRFRREDGRGIGQFSPYSFPRLHPVDDDIRETVDRRAFRTLINQPLPIATVRKLLAVLAEAEKQGEENQ